MPIYEYVCEKCDNHLEIIQKITEETLTTCPECDGVLKKMISNTSFILKGTGWYVTDYASGKNNAGINSPDQKQKDSTAVPAEAAAIAKEPAVLTK